MNIWNDIKSGFQRGSKKVIEVTEDLFEKSKESGSEGLETVQEFLSQIGEKTADVTSVLKLKLEIGSLQKQLDQELLFLGKLILKQNQISKPNFENIEFKDQLDKMLNLDQQIQSLHIKHDEIRKEISSDYVVNKLSEDLYASGAVIEQAYVADDANVIGKMLKEILLPKQALISAIKRGDEMIIPNGNTKIQAGDQITIIGKTEDVEKVYKRLTTV